MGKVMNNHAIELLESWSTRKQTIDILRFELEHFTGIRKNETLEAMALAHGDGAGRSSGHISEKTLYIALNYQNKTDTMNADAKESIVVELVALEQTQQRLEYYLSLLDTREAEVLRLTYINKLSQEKIAKSMDMSVRTVQTLKSKALKGLTKMYQLIENLS